MNKKYYDGFSVVDILFKNLEPRKMLKVLNEFAESDGVDAVEVVRCRDCARHDSDGYCFEHGKKTDGADFCSWAKRREE